MAEQKRVPRTQDTREEGERVPEWKPPSQRIELKNTEDHIFRWVRVQYNGQDDPNNMQKKLSEGYVVVRPDDSDISDQVARGVLPIRNGRIERGGLVLCKMLRRLADQRNSYYANEAKLHQQSVSNALRRERHDSMPLTEDIKRSKDREG
jgi:hypothetical protein